MANLQIPSHPSPLAQQQNSTYSVQIINPPNVPPGNANHGQIPALFNTIHSQLLKQITRPIILDGAKLGSGGYGDVVAKLRNINGIPTLVARKFFKQTSGYDHELYNILCFHNPGSPCIVKFIDESGPQENPRYIDYELYPNGTLYDMIASECNRRTYEFDDILAWTIDIMTGLEYMHLVLNMAHLDIKPQNIFIDKNFDAVLGDLGTSHIYPIPLHHFSTGIYAPPEFRAGDIPSHFNGRLNKVCPPKSSRARQFWNFDTFSLGTTLIPVLHPIKHRLKTSIDRIDEVIYDNQPINPTIPNIPPWFLQLVQRMIDRSPQIRPSITAILDMPMFEIFLESKGRRRWLRANRILQNQLKGLKNNLTASENSLNLQAQDITLKDREIRSLNIQVHNLSNSITLAQEVSQITTSTLDELKTKMEANNTELERLNNLTQSYQEQAETDKQKHSNLETQIKQLESQIEGMQLDAISNQAEIESLRTNNESLLKENNTFTNELHTRANMREALKSTISTQAAEI